jgi:hypothetical protein
MTDHLRPEEFVEAIDAAEALDAAGRAHLAQCEVCQRELADLRDMMQETTKVSASAPSPLFWDHFSERVRVATSTVPVRAPWWQGWGRTAGVIGAAVAAVALVMILQPRIIAPLRPADSAVTPTPALVTADAVDDGTWSIVVGVAAGLKYADVKDAAQPVSGTADAVIDELTPAQRTALARLLEKEMGEQ